MMESSSAPQPNNRSVRPLPRDRHAFRNIHSITSDPLKMFQSLIQTHGDTFQFPLLMWKVVFLNHPDGVQHVLQTNNKNYNKQNADYRIIKQVTGEGLLTSDGDFWLRQRRMIQPIFQRKRIDEFGTMMVQTTQDMLEQRWTSLHQEQTTFDIAEEMMRLTLSIVGKALFTTDLGDLAETVSQSFIEVSRRLGSYNLWVYLPSWFPSAGNRRYQNALNALDSTVHRLIKQRRQEISTLPSDEVPEDLLTFLIRAEDEESNETMTNQQVRDEVITLMLAGHETTANALSWTWYLLSQHPDVAEKLHHELDSVMGDRPPTVADLSSLPYNRQVIEESMRLFPPAWATTRNTCEEDEFNGFRIPKGSIALVCPYTTHRHPDFWEDPERFWPERFAPKHSQGRPKYAYFPFGGGPRLCIGKHFAMMEAQLLLATMAQRYHVKLDPSVPIVPEPLITMRPKHGVHVTLIQRNERA